MHWVWVAKLVNINHDRTTLFICNPSMLPQWKGSRKIVQERETGREKKRKFCEKFKRRKYFLDCLKGHIYYGWISLAFPFARAHTVSSRPCGIVSVWHFAPTTSCCHAICYVDSLRSCPSAPVAPVLNGACVIAHTQLLVRLHSQWRRKERERKQRVMILWGEPCLKGSQFID